MQVRPVNLHIGGAISVACGAPIENAQLFAGFTVIPYITLYNTLNVGLTEAQIPWIYLCGGAATLVSARWVGRLSDFSSAESRGCPPSPSKLPTISFRPTNYWRHND